MSIFKTKTVPHGDFTRVYITKRGKTHMFPIATTNRLKAKFLARKQLRAQPK